jgi:dTDP-4-amino-4,6-dideoxygalactose transaminase
MIPFSSWDGVNDHTGTSGQRKLEQFLGPASAVFSTYQAAITATLEVMGSRTHELPVIMSISASPDTIAAVLRSGATPLLLDINPNTLQLDTSLLKEVLEELEAAVVILDRPAGLSIDPELLEIVDDLPTIIDTRLIPSLDMAEACVGTFTVFDLGPMIGTGAVVIHKYADQLNELKIVRNGVLGLAAHLNDTLSLLAYDCLKADPTLAKRKAVQKGVVETYASLFEGKLDCILTQDTEWPYFVVFVDNADKVIAHLHSYDIAALKPIYPLHLLPNISRRWAEKPEYPNVESIYNNLVALPTHSGVVGKEADIVSKLLEVSGS